MRASTPTTLLLLAASAAAQTTPNITTTFFNFLLPYPATASVLAAEPSPGLTTYIIDMLDCEDTEDCTPGIPVTVGPSTLAWTFPVDPASLIIPVLSEVIECQIQGTTKAVCTGPNDYEVGNEPHTPKTATARVDTFTGSQLSLQLGAPLIVTAGAEKLVAAEASASASAATTTGESGGAKGVSTTATPALSASSMGTASSTGVAASSTSADASSANRAAQLGVTFAGVVASVFFGILGL